MAIEPHELAESSGQPALPTYHTVADVLEKKNGSGIRLVGWTAARAVLIGAPMLLVKVEPKKAIVGSLLASAFISLFTLVRVYNAEFEVERGYLKNRRWLRSKSRGTSGALRRRK